MHQFDPSTIDRILVALANSREGRVPFSNKRVRSMLSLLFIGQKSALALYFKRRRTGRMR